MTLEIDSAAQATPEWLTQTLYEAGVLKKGKVVRLESTANTAYHAQTTRLRVEYEGAEPEPPTRLFLKLLTEHKGKREVETYRQLMRLPRYPAMTVPCYAASYDSVSGSSSLLLADVSATHREVSSRAEVRTFTPAPPLGQVEALVDTLARWHASWWGFGGATQLPAERFAIFTDETSYRDYAAHCRNAWFHFAEAEPTVAAEVAQIYLPLLEKLPLLWSRHLAHRFEDRANLTLIHGDCYFSQFLCPMEGKGRTFIIDFDSVRLDTPTDDLVSLTTFWQREARAEYEWAMLERYHNALCRAGVETYAWETFLADYRFSALQHVMYPILGQHGGDEQSFWRSRLSASTATYDTWDCASLLKMGGSS